MNKYILIILMIFITMKSFETLSETENRNPRNQPTNKNGQSTQPFKRVPYQFKHKVDLGTIVELSENIGDAVVGGHRLFTFKDDPYSDATNVHYVNKLNMKAIAFSAGEEHVVVANEVFIPVNSGLLALKRKPSWIMIIANKVYYEGPIKLTSLGGKSSIVFSAKQILQKSRSSPKSRVLKKSSMMQKRAVRATQSSVKQQQVFSSKSNLRKVHSSNDKKIMPFSYKPDNFVGYTKPVERREQELINRLAIKNMQLITTQMKQEKDLWKKDRLLQKFQDYRFNHVKVSFLNLDAKYDDIFNRLVEIVLALFTNSSDSVIREIGGEKILVNANIDNFPEKPFMFYPIPGKATLLPIMNRKTANLDALGTIRYNSVGDAGLSLIFELEIGHQEKVLEQLKKLLVQKGSNLETLTPNELLSIKRQHFRINDRAIGTIIPISDNILRVEVDLPEEGKTIAEIFPKQGNATFDLEYTVSDSQQTLSKTIPLIVDSAIIEQLDYNQKLFRQFNVVGNSSSIQYFNVTSMMKGALDTDEEGVLDYVTICAAIKFPEETIYFGPYRLSSERTLGAEVVFSFIKRTENYMTDISGWAKYENGMRYMEPTSTSQNYISLQESMFNYTSSPPRKSGCGLALAL